jgi:hypothetical protein
MSDHVSRQQVVELLTEKAQVKQKVYDHTFAAFNMLKSLQQEITDEYNQRLKDADPRVQLKYRSRGDFESELKVAGDLLLFSMHSNIFEFDREHHIWSLPYVKDSVLNSYCGIIHVYNFLSDSFKYNRENDLGYLITRVFVNHENHFFVEGKRQGEFSYKHFPKQTANGERLGRIVQTAIQYALQFDLLVPPYDHVKIASVAQMNQKIISSKLQTGKRIGFKFNSDDVQE